MKISCNIDEIIKYLKLKALEGYETVELIDKNRRNGWKQMDPNITFVFNKEEPTVLGIYINDEDN